MHPDRNLPGGPPAGPARRQRRQVGGKLRSDAQPLVAVPNLGGEHGEQLADWVAGLGPQGLDCGLPSLITRLAVGEYGPLPLLTVAERPEVHDQFSAAA